MALSKCVWIVGSVLLSNAMASPTSVPGLVASAVVVLGFEIAESSLLPHGTNVSVREVANRAIITVFIRTPFFLLHTNLNRTGAKTIGELPHRPIGENPMIRRCRDE